MNIAISNIAWTEAFDDRIYSEMADLGICGLEIAPTRVFGEDPYNNLSNARRWAKERKYEFVIPSMQSIWFGMNENLFRNEADRTILFDYTKKAIDFAESISCKNLVFGCPRNRNGGNNKMEIAISFFKELGDYAMAKNTCVGIEAVPKNYHTDFLNTTVEVIDFVRRLNSPGIRLNFDLGALLTNDENLKVIDDDIDIISHVHISEPELVKIKRRDIHQELKEILENADYTGFVSIEMRQQDRVEDIIETLEYIKEVMEG